MCVIYSETFAGVKIFFCLLMVAAGEDSDFFVGYLIDDPVFLIYAARPTAFEFVFERFGFADAGERLAPDFFYQADDA